MIHTTHNVLLKFYDSFSKLDAKRMAECYHPDATFTDPAFGKLTYDEVCAMWKMLIERSKGNLSVEFFDLKSSKKNGTAKWVATYNFSKTDRKVVNEIYAKFKFQDGLIIKHTDSFSLWKWSGMALGLKGYLLGWTPFMRNKIREQAKDSLNKYLAK